MTAAGSREDAARAFRCVGVDITTGVERWMDDRATDFKNADARMRLAVIRRGCDVEFFKVVEEPYVLAALAGGGK